MPDAGSHAAGTASIPDTERNPDQLRVLQRLCEFSHQLYAEEADRSRALNQGSRNLYLVLAATVAFIGAVAKWLTPTGSDFFPEVGQWLFLALAVAASSLVLAAFVFCLLASRVRQFERLCDPLELAARSALITREIDMLAEISANQLVAADRNHAANERKARHLAIAYLCYFCSIGLFLLASVTFAIWQAGVTI